MANFGLFPEGLLRPTLSEVRDEIEAEFRAEFGALPMGDRTLLGFLIGAVAERDYLKWETLEVILSSQDRDKAFGLALRSLGLLMGTLAIAPAPSTVMVTLCGDDGVVVTGGSQAHTASTERVFVADEDSDPLAALDSWVASTAYAVGDRVTNSSRCYVCITSGESAGSGGPSDQIDDETDNTVHWRYLGEGTAAIDAPWVSLETGPIVAVAGDLTEIDTPIPGWQSIRNLEDADLGSVEQTDEDFRLFMDAEIARPGTGTPPAIKADVGALDGVTAVFVFFNDTDSVDADGLPPHSVEVLVDGGDDQAIWDTLLNSIPVGIQMVGDEEGTAIDEEGEEHLVRFSRPEQLSLYTTITLQKYPKTYAGDAAVTQSVVDGGDGRGIGQDAVASAISHDAQDVAGVKKVVEVRVFTDAIETGSPWAALTGYSATPGSRDVVTNGERSYICITSGTSAASGGPSGTGTDITDGSVHWRFLGADVEVTSRQVADYDTSRTTVLSSDAT